MHTPPFTDEHAELREGVRRWVIPELRTIAGEQIVAPAISACGATCGSTASGAGTHDIMLDVIGRSYGL